MAERRMFAKQIIDSDAFLDMPLSAQALYFHLAMRADDDGFINNPRKIQRMIGASEDDCKLLLMKRFLIAFESGIVVVKHWKIHNYIRGDRKKKTTYTKEMAQLIEKENGSYTLISELPANVGQMSGKCQADDSQMPGNCPHRLGEDRIGKDSLGELRVGEDKSPATPAPALDPQIVIDLYNSICTSLPAVRTPTPERRMNASTAIRTFSLEDIETCFKKAEASSFLKGQKKGGFKASFDWLIKVENMAKVIEGNYDDAPANANSSYEVNDFFRAAIDKSYAERTEASRNNPPQTAADDPELYERAQALKSQIG